MPGASEIKAGEAFVEIVAKDIEFVKRLAEDKKRWTSWGKEMTEIGLKMGASGAAIVTPLLGAAEAFKSFGSEIAQASKRTGIASEQLSLLKYAADQTGVGFESLEGGLKKMQKTIFDAAQGGKEGTEALGYLGLTAQELAGKLPDRQLEMIADRLNAITDPTEKAAISMKVFGKSGTDMIPMLEGGGRAIEEFMQHGKALGAQLSTEDAEAAEKFERAMKDMETAMKMVTINIGGALAPALGTLAESLANAVGPMSELAKKNKDLIVEAAGAATGLITFGSALAGVAIVANTVSRASDLLSKVLSSCGTSASLATPAIYGLAAAVALLSAAEARSIATGENFDESLYKKMHAVVGNDMDDIVAAMEDQQRLSEKIGEQRNQLATGMGKFGEKLGADDELKIRQDIVEEYQKQLELAGQITEAADRLNNSKMTIGQFNLYGLGVSDFKANLDKVRAELEAAKKELSKHPQDAAGSTPATAAVLNTPKHHAAKATHHVDIKLKEAVDDFTKTLEEANKTIAFAAFKQGKTALYERGAGLNDDDMKKVIESGATEFSQKWFELVNALGRARAILDEENAEKKNARNESKKHDSAFTKELDSLTAELIKAKNALAILFGGGNGGGSVGTGGGAQGGAAGGAAAGGAMFGPLGALAGYFLGGAAGNAAERIGLLDPAKQQEITYSEPRPIGAFNIGNQGLSNEIFGQRSEPGMLKAARETSAATQAIHGILLKPNKFFPTIR